MSGIKKVFVTGAKGQLGYDVVHELLSRGYDVIGSDIQPEWMDIEDNMVVSDEEAGNSGRDVRNLDEENGDRGRCVEAGGIFTYVSLDICSTDDSRRIIMTSRPDAVVHCAAWTAVDAAEDIDVRDMVYKVNVDGTRNIAEICNELDCKMVYISTDYVFDGQGDIPWSADCRNFAPQNVYGRTKLEGEMAVSELLDKFFIVRIAWVFGIHGGNFVETMLRLGKTHEALRVVDDQIGTPTYTFDLSRLLVDMLETDRYGYYHATNEGGYISWYDFACEIFRQAGYSTKVIPVSTDEYGSSKAARPYNSRLDKSKLLENGFEPLPDWHDALERYIKTLRI